MGGVGLLSAHGVAIYIEISDNQNLVITSTALFLYLNCNSPTLDSCKYAGTTYIQVHIPHVCAFLFNGFKDFFKQSKSRNIIRSFKRL